MGFICTREIAEMNDGFYVRFKEVNVYSYIYNYDSDDAFYYVPNILRYTREGRTNNSDPIIFSDNYSIFESFMGNMNDFFELYDRDIINYGDFVCQNINEEFFIVFSRLAAFYLYIDSAGFFYDPRKEIEKYKKYMKFFVGISFSDPTGMRINFFRTDDNTYLPFYENDQYRSTVEGIKLLDSVEEASQMVRDMYNDETIIEGAKSISKMISGSNTKFEMLICSDVFMETEREVFDV